MNLGEPKRLYVTMTLRAGRDSLRTRGWYSFDHVRHTVDLRIEANNASARFFAEHYGRTIEVHIEDIPNDDK